MGIGKSLGERFDIARWHIPVLVMLIVGPLLGLGYIVGLPFIGVAAFIAVSGYRTTRQLVPR